MTRPTPKAKKRRTGFSVGESVIAIGVLVIVVASVGKFSDYVRGGIDGLRLSKLIHWETQNIREQIGSWPVEQVTLDKIQAIELSPQLAYYLSDAKWNASITPTSIVNSVGQTTFRALEVKLQLIGKYKGQLIQPIEHHFWILNEAKAIQPEDQPKEPTEKAEVN